MNYPRYWKLKPKLLIVDGRNMLWRTTDAFSDLYVEKNGKHIATGGIYGFLSTIIKIWQRYGGKTVVAWEGTNNFRYKLYPNYKNRGPMTPEFEELLEEVNDQQTRVQAILRRAGIEQYKGVECEADDIMGMLAHLWTRTGEGQATIYTADGDLRQCVTVYTWVVSPGRKGKEVVYDVEGVKTKDGVYPKEIPDLKALAGDPSDKIPGLPGIGQVTAAKLVNEFGSIKKIIKASKKESTWNGQSERFRLIVKKNRKDVRLYKKLTKIKKDADYKEIKVKRNKVKLLKHLMYYKFHTLVQPSEMFNLMNMGKDED
jgi:DNA polymerase-1